MLSVEPTEELLYKVIDEHSHLKGMCKSTAEYKVIQEAAELPMYGMEYHECKNSSNMNVMVGVGPEGIFVYNHEDMELIEK